MDAYQGLEHYLNEGKREVFYNGPSFLKQFNEDQYLQANNVSVDTDNTDYSNSSDAKVSCYNEAINTLSNSSEELNYIDNIMDTKRYSNLNKLYIVTSFVMRFIGNLRRKRNNEQLLLEDVITLDEISQAKRVWLKANQDVLRHGSNFHNLKQQLNLFEDEFSFLHCKGRLLNAELPYSTKYPIIENTG